MVASDDCTGEDDATGGVELGDIRAGCWGAQKSCDVDGAGAVGGDAFAAGIASASKKCGENQGAFGIEARVETLGISPAEGTGGDREVWR